MKAFFRSIFLALMLVPGCKDPFDPKLPFEESNFLVVEGYINVGEDAVTTIKLSRTTQVKQGKVRPNYELDASIFIIDDIGEIYSVIERGQGRYSTDSLSLPLDRNYRLQIITTNGNEYYSEFTTPSVSPEIDSVYWQFAREGVTIFLATHDPQNQTDYYQWDYEEIWEERSPFFSIYSYSRGVYTFRPYEEIQEMRRCWKDGYPAGLLITSVATLVPNSPIAKPLIFIPRGTVKLAEKYSVLVKQHALSKEAYDYLRIMEKNTTQVGSFFDPQPSQLNSNISSSDSGDPVVGYIGAYTTSQKRIIIKPEDLPEWTYSLYCTSVLVTDHPDSLKKYYETLGYIPITFVQDQGGDATATKNVCIDCRMRGGKGGDANKPFGWDE